MKEVLVFGGSGFLGEYLVKELIKVKYNVTIADLNPGHPNFNFIKCDILSNKDLDLVFKNHYDYVVVNRNICNTNSTNSNLGNSILLEFDRLDNFRTKLNWNFYNGWIDNPNKYEIQKLNSSGNWELFRTLDNTENEIIINE